jgi:16S rRNA C967 or C1407 C5-methylase (RsmB/RsmF family)/NOL1/NOP2/fmu family ribosome biogenesis protein
MLPQEFIRRTKDLLRDEYSALETALESQPPVSLRINPHKLPAGAPGEYEKVPWCRTGYYLPERPAFTSDPLFHAGAYYVQEASSMFLEQVLPDITAEAALSRKPLTVLDLCAAPGGKSTHLLSLLPEGSLLVSNEVIRSRSAILAENVAKWGRAGIITTCNDPKDFGRLKHLFDVILADLPCSGEGMFRRDPAARNEWSVDHVRLCASRQKRIVRDAWDALKPGGRLIYSTCTFNTEENEDSVCALAEEAGADVIPVAVKPEWNIAGALRHGIPACRFFPHRTRGEGFFIAVMRKNGEPSAAADRRPAAGKRNSGLPSTISAEIKNMLSEPYGFRFLAGESIRPAARVYALPEVHAGVHAILAKTLNIVSAGTLLGEFKGNAFAPSAALALSTERNPDAFPAAELSYENAIRYLQKEAVILPSGTPKGYVLVSYKDMPLGFVKNIGNRANNLYPPEWRIRKRIV